MAAVEALYKEKEQLKINHEMTGCLDGRLRMEKEKKESLEKILHEERDRITNIREENAQLKVIATVSSFRPLKLDNGVPMELPRGQGQDQ